MSNPAELEISVRLCDGRSPVAQHAWLRTNIDGLTLVSAAGEISYARQALSVSPRVGHAPRFVTLPDGAELECPDAAWLDELTQQERTEGPVAWLERRWWAAAVSVALTALGLTLGYFFALDALCDRVAQCVPIEREQRFGDRTLRSLDRHFLMPSTLDPERREQLEIRFARLIPGKPQARSVRLIFRHGGGLGANAFTLPGGTIIVTDELVLLLSSDDEVLAVLAHELGHAHYRHALRQAVRSSVSGAVGMVVLGDASSVAAGSGAALLLLGTEFSREFERQADAYAADLLRQNLLSPDLFASALEKLRMDRANRGLDEGFSFLSSHPGSVERIARAHEAAASTSSDLPR